MKSLKLCLILGCAVFSLSSLAHHHLFAASSSNLLLAQTNPAPSPSATTNSSPLLKAGRQLLSLERYQLESVMEVTADLPGAFLSSNLKINTTVEAPNKINSQMTFVSPNGLSGKTYQIVSDGSQVWIYDSSTNQYSVSNLQQFLQTREGFLIGTLSYFYVSTRSNIGNSGVVANFVSKLPEAQLIEYFQRFANINLRNAVIRDETLEGKVYKTYNLRDASKGLQATVYVDAAQESIAQVNLAGTKDGLQLASQEKIINQSVPESIPANQFSFSPADDVQQVTQQISIQPF